MCKFLLSFPILLLNDSSKENGIEEVHLKFLTHSPLKDYIFFVLFHSSDSLLRTILEDNIKLEM